VKPLRFAIVGMGEIAREAHLPALRRRDDIELVTVVDTRQEQLQRAAAGLAPTARRSTRLEDVFDDAIDAVVVATPPWHTTGIVEECLRRGLYVLAEKPIAPALGAAERLSALDAAQTARLQIGFTYRHHPSLERLRSMLASGWFGWPVAVRISVFDERLDPVGHPDHYRRILETMKHGSPIVHDGAHLCDWVSFLLDDQPVDVRSIGLQTDSSFPAPNYEAALLAYPNASVATLEVGWMCPALPVGHFSVLGPRGMATLDLRTFALVLDGGEGSERVEADGDHVAVCFDRQLEKFVSACRSGARPVPGLDEALASLALSERIARAREPTPAR
jgi:predicted dehydrogenase